MNKSVLKLVAAAALLCGAQTAFSQSLVAPTTTGVINGTGQTFTVAFTSAATAGIDFDLNVGTAGRITITGGTSNFGANCSVAAMGQTLICNAFAASGTLTSGTVTVTYNAAGTTGPVALNLANVVFRDGNAAVQPIPPAVVTNGTLTLNAGASGPSLTYNPATGPITVAASGSGTAVTSNIAVTAAGGDTGQSTTLACSVTGAGFATPVVTGSPFAGGTTSTGNVGLGCAGSATTGSLSCTETRSGPGGGSPIVTTFALNCASAPGFASTPAPNGTVTISGIQGSTASGAIAVSNPGTAPLTLSGTIAGNAGITLGTVPATVAAGATVPVPLSCAVPAVAGTTITATVTLNAQTTPATTATYTVNCVSQSASIPTLGFGGKALMVLLMLGFGLVGFQLYRRSA